MNDHFQQTIALNADPAKVYAAIATTAGLRGWWTTACNGDTRIGGVIHFGFECADKDMRVEHLEANREVRWLCTHAHIGVDGLAHRDEWVGTRMVFRLAASDGGRTRLDFEHIGLVPELECYDLCDKGWRYFLDSLKQFVETGRGTPHTMPVAA